MAGKNSMRDRILPQLHKHLGSDHNALFHFDKPKIGQNVVFPQILQRSAVSYVSPFKSSAVSLSKSSADSPSVVNGILFAVEVLLTKW